MTAFDRIELTDGRHLEFRVSGPAEGLPFVFHHGTPGCGAPLQAVERSAHAHGLRVVSLCRPGYGGSSRQPGRRVVDVVADTAEVLAVLDAPRCVVGGWSGGGPHALACAARLPQAAAALVISGLAPYGVDGLDFTAGMGNDNLVEFRFALRGAAPLRLYLDMSGEGMRAVTAESLTESLNSLLPAVDRQALTGEFASDMTDDVHQALRLGIDGWLDDDLAFVTPWGFELEEVSIPSFIWQGSDDLMVPSSHGQWLAAHVPHATVHLQPGEGHLWSGMEALDRMLDELIAADRSA
jgi:pimeloyl-ACP methyl ester carboxylesterase